MSALPVLFTTPRLQAQAMTDPALLPDMLAVYGHAPSMRWVGDGQPLDIAGCRAWLDVTERNFALRGYGMCALRRLDGSQVLGFAGLVHPGSQAQAEIKYALHPHQAGQGLATEAAVGLLAWGHQRFHLSEVIATTAAENTASHRVLGKAGLVRQADRLNDDLSLIHI